MLLNKYDAGRDSFCSPGRPSRNCAAALLFRQSSKSTIFRILDKRHSAVRGGGVLVIEYVLSSDPWGIGGFLLSVLRQMIGGRRRFSEQMHLRRSYTAAEHGAGGDGDSEYCWPAGRENRETRRAERLAFIRSASLQAALPAAILWPVEVWTSKVRMTGSASIRCCSFSRTVLYCS